MSKQPSISDDLKANFHGAVSNLDERKEQLQSQINETLQEKEHILSEINKLNAILNNKNAIMESESKKSVVLLKNLDNLQLKENVAQELKVSIGKETLATEERIAQLDTVLHNTVNKFHDAITKTCE